MPKPKDAALPDDIKAHLETHDEAHVIQNGSALEVEGVFAGEVYHIKPGANLIVSKTKGESDKAVADHIHGQLFGIDGLYRKTIKKPDEKPVAKPDVEK